MCHRNGGNGPVESWLMALGRILGMDIDIIVPGHRPITDKDDIQQVKVYWEYVKVLILF